MALHNRYNNENILVRAVIAGLLNILNNKITYEQVWSNEDIETVEVPWYYNMSGDERFMQDFYTHYGDCIAPKPADGNFDMIPRGVITYTGSEIDSARTTSRYVQANFLKEVNGQLQSFRAFLYLIPLNVNFDCEIWLDTQITGLKVEQMIREVFYKTITFYIFYKGLRMGCSVGFPESVTLEKNINYSFEQDNKIKLTFNLQVEAYQPVFDNTTEVEADSYMKGIGYRLVDKKDLDNDGEIIITTDYNNKIVPKGIPLVIEWDYKQENAVINRVDVAWTLTTDNVKTNIEKGVINHEYYVWNIPDTFTSFKPPQIIWDTESAVKAYREPVIRIAPNISTGEIDTLSFYVVDSGYFVSPMADTSINAILEMRDTNNRVVYSGDASLYFNIVDYQIDENDPVTLPYGNIIYPGNIDYKTINLYVINSVVGHSVSLSPSDNTQPYGVITNLTIV
jgi:hypothetical protein